MSTVRVLYGTDYLILGYKQFNAYLSSPEPSEEAFKTAVEHMKLSTRQYSRRQISWIRNKLLPAVYATNSKETVTPTYLLDATGKHTFILKCF
jgi:tRNA dimethylallyltransferase